jgi:hypothetical protein
MTDDKYAEMRSRLSEAAYGPIKSARLDVPAGVVRAAGDVADVLLPVVDSIVVDAIAAERVRLRRVINRLPGQYTVGPSNYGHVFTLWQVELLATLGDPPEGET